MAATPLRDWLLDPWRCAPLRTALLAPLAAVFAAVSGLRRHAYRRGWLRAQRLAVPVVVIGNLSVGGSGKTPLTLWLARRLTDAGRHPVIVSRGYGGSLRGVRRVRPEDDAALVGDEPHLLATRAGCPVWVGADRAAAARAALAEYPACDLLIADDGLQHYRLHRDLEIVVVDPRGFGNGWPLPAGPLRETRARLRSVDAVVFNGAGTGHALPPGVRSFRMRIEGAEFYRIGDPGERVRAAHFAGRRVVALAGIGQPERFFRQLERLGIRAETHAFPDHHRYVAADLAFGPGATLLMTEKDAVKCAPFAPEQTWVLPVTASVEPDLARYVLEAACGHPPA